MTPSQAAAIIGCTPQQVRTLIRTGKLRARRIAAPVNRQGYVYDITPGEARRYARKPQQGGYPRGASRK